MIGTRFFGIALPALLVVLVACEPQTDQQDGQMETDEPMTEQQPTTDERTQQRTVAFAEWDADGDERLSADEFRTWWNEEGPVQDWDLQDEQDEITREEFSEHLFEMWDQDDSGSLTETEFADAADRWFEDQIDQESFSDWDADGNGEIDQDEFMQGLQDAQAVDRIDADAGGSIQSQELADWYFEALDVDGDGYLDNSEWQAAEERGLDV